MSCSAGRPPERGAGLATWAVTRRRRVGSSCTAWLSAGRGVRARVMGWLLRHRSPRQRVRLEHLIALLLVDRGRDLLGTLRRALLPSPAWVRARYEGLGSSLPGFYLAHCRRLAEILSRARGGFRDRAECAKR